MPPRRGGERRGVALEVSAAWLRGLATGIPVLVAAYWSVALAWRAWRGALWRDGRDRFERLESRLAARVRARRAGWEVRGARGWVRVGGGLGGVGWTARRADGARQKGRGWPDADALDAWFSEPGDHPAA